jgi:alpha-amylase/alpha-mannosidase (GH57 family)
LERHHPATYAKIIEADRLSSLQRSGHGNAIAQAYGHPILPLCNTRDRLTQVLWGLEDFRYRFAREPESLWLPETACDEPTLEVLIEQNLRWVILAPNQAGQIRRPGSTAWTSVTPDSLNTSVPYRYLHRDGSGRFITIFFYNGPASRGIAFDSVLQSSRRLVDLLLQAVGKSPMISIATDGETYGHHFKFGDLCLAHAMEVEAPEAGLTLTNFGEYLDQHPAEIEVKIATGSSGEGSSWSCAHGVDRWLRDCGCGSYLGWNQQWRTPLRTALEFLRDEAARQFETVGGDVFVYPWAARNAYVQVILNHGRSRAEFLKRHAGRQVTTLETQRALAFLEMQRFALLMFTSCGWFFSDISGIETLQVLKYAARVIELMHELELPSAREKFIEILGEARSNVPAEGSGADIFLRLSQNTRSLV